MASALWFRVTRKIEKSGYIPYPGVYDAAQNLPNVNPPTAAEMPKSRISLSFSVILSLCLVLLSWPVALRSGATSPLNAVARNLLAEPPRKSNNLTDVVQWDNYTLFVNNQRILL